MPSYDAGEAFLSVLPSLRGFTQRLKRELTGVRVELEIPATVNLDRRGLAELRQVARTIPAIVLDADSSPADRELAAVRDRIERLSGKTIGIDISGDAARTEIDSIQAELQRLGREAPSIGVRVDAGAAEAALAGVHRSAAQLDGRRVNVRVIVDAVQAIASIASIALAVNEFANRKYRFTVEADTFGAIASITALAAKVSALGGLAGIVGGFGGALGGLGAAGAVAAGGLGAAVLASLGVGKALSALGAQQDSAAQDAQQSAKQQQSAAYAIASAQDRVKQASQSASRARTEGARSVADAEKSASKQVAQALSAQAMAQRTLRQATSDLEQEQSDLSRAWEEGRRSLQDLQAQVTGNSIDQRQAAIDLKDARKELDTARASGNADAIDRATVAYDRQKATVDQLAVQGKRLASDNASAQKKGVAGTDQVVSANDRIAAATLRQSDAAVAARAADAAVVDARVSGADSVARAQEQADQRIADADQQVIEAQRALTQALAQTGDSGQSSADKVSAAFADLSPEAAAFARYLFGLKPLLQDLSGVAASQFFPPLQAGLGLLVAQAPLISGVVSQLAAGMGAGLNLVLTQLASPFWTGFFQLLGGAAGKIIPALFQVLMNLAGAAAILVTDLLPLAPAAFSFLDEVSQLLVVLSPFIAQLLGGLIPAASAFLSALYPLGPVLAALQPILLVLGQAFATVLMTVLQALAPILVALTPLIQTLATTFANQLVGAIQAGTPFLLWLAGWLSANPGLVIGVITVLGGLAAAFKPLLFVLGIVVTALHAFLIRFAALSLLRFAGLEATLFGRVLMTLLSPLNLVRTVFGFLVTMVGRLFSPMQLISGAGRLLGSAIMGIGRAILGALGPFGIILTILGLLYSSNEEFRGTVQKLLQVLLGLGVQLINALLPAFQQVMDAVAPLAGLFGSVLTPIIGVLADVLVQLINTVLPPLVGLLTGFVIPVVVTLAKILSTVLVWVIQNLVVPALQFLAWVVLNILVPAITWLWQNVFAPIFRAIGALVTFIWKEVLKPQFDAFVWLLNNVIGPVVMWLWRNVVQPAFNGIGAVVSWVWLNIIKPTLDAVGGGLEWLAKGFEFAVSHIGDIWRGLKNLLAVPINFLIGTVFNGGIRKAWNFVADLLPGIEPIGELPLIPEAKSGGIPYPNRYTPGRDIGPVMVSGYESVMRPEFTRAVGPARVDQWNAAARTGGVAGVRRALTGTELALGGDRANPGAAYRGAALPGYAAGGVVDKGLAWANQQQGKPYGWGAAGPNAYDCTGFQSALINTLYGSNPPYHRLFSTASFTPNRAPGGLVPGLTSGYAIGVTRDAGDGVGHAAGTIGGVNVESRGGDGVVIGAAARGADHPLFNMQFSLPWVGGSFASGGTAGGSGGGFFDWIGGKIRGFFTDLTDPPINALESTFPTPPKFMGIPAQAARKFRDGALDFLLGSAASTGGAAGAAPSAQVHAWVLEALSILGFPASYAAGIEQQIMTESGGDPSVTQHGYTDVNTLSGNLAQGIMQVIPPTFRANMLPGHGDPFNPVDNIIAGSRYAMARYGPSWFAAGPQHDHGYDSGGVGKGIGWMWKGTGLDERVLPPQETQAYPTLTRLTQQLEAGRLPVPTGMSASQYATAIAGGSERASGKAGNTYNFNAAAWDERRMLREIDRRDDARTRTT